MSCPTNTVSPAGSTEEGQCEAKPGFYGPPGQQAEQCPGNTYNPNTGSTLLEDCMSCPTNTESPAGSTEQGQCVAKPGFYGPPGEEPTRCPGNLVDSDITDHNISTVSGATVSSDCVYNRCTGEEFRSNQARCEPYTYIENCPDGQILIAGKQDNDSINYTEYTPGIEADYSTSTIYGHDNLCLPKSDICAANSDDASLISVEYETCQAGEFRNNQAECQPYTYIENCPDGQILIAGKQNNGSTYYTAYTPGIEADYSTPTIYGHDNLCLPKSEICY